MTPSEELSTVEGRLHEWAKNHQEELAAYLLDLVEMETPSEDPETFEPFFDQLAEDFSAVGFETDRVPGDETGGWLEAWTADSGQTADIQLVIGHADSVWPQGTVAEKTPEIRDGVLEGPGALDMKGGLAQAVYALRAIDALSLDPSVPIHLLVSSDEEIGSPESKSRIVELAKLADRVFVLEPAGGPEGKIKTARKAVGHFTVTIEGKAAHAGLEPEEGASATEELGTVIHRLHKLTDVESGVTVNVGEVEAGLRSNVVAPQARAEVDVRAPTAEAADTVAERIRSLKAETSGTELTVKGGFGRPPMEPTPANQRLWERVKTIGKRLDLTLESTHSGGASDGNYASQHAATIDGFGAVGDGAHQTYEYVELERLVDRVSLLAACLLDEPLGTDQQR